MTRCPRSKTSRRLLALALGWLLAEVLLMPLVSWLAPLRIRVRLPSPMFVLGERSKAGILPEDYVLVIGDSNAEGHGDWLRSAVKQGGDPPFQATHVLHERTGRDVITFGRGGADSVSAIVFVVEKRFATLWRTGFGEPSDVLVYFYEGNDLNGNLKQARRRLGLGDRAVDSYDDQELDAFIADRARSGFREGLPGMLYVPYLLLNAVKGESFGEGGARVGIQVRPHAAQVGPSERNVFAVGDRRFQFVGTAQAPSLELTEEELELSFRLLERSLAWARKRFEAASLTLVYVPSPLACYELASAEVETQTYEGREAVYPAEAVQRRSRELRRRARELAEAFELGFVDATEDLQAAARREPIHGPMDGKHLNRAGYAALGEVLARELPRSGR